MSHWNRSSTTRLSCPSRNRTSPLRSPASEFAPPSCPSNDPDGDPLMTDRYIPTKDDKFSFGLWTVGWQGVDVFGGAVRPLLDPVESVHRLPEPGAAAGALPDDDPGADDATRGAPPQRVKKGPAGARPRGGEGAAEPVRAP